MSTDLCTELFAGNGVPVRSGGVFLLLLVFMYFRRFVLLCRYGCRPGHRGLHHKNNSRKLRGLERTFYQSSYLLGHVQGKENLLRKAVKPVSRVALITKSLANSTLKPRYESYHNVPGPGPRQVTFILLPTVRSPLTWRGL
jgi:hypothetical protein